MKYVQLGMMFLCGVVFGCALLMHASGRTRKAYEGFFLTAFGIAFTLKFL